MANAQYQVVFRGEMTGEVAEETVKKNLAAMFKMPEQKVEGLFSGRPVVIKKRVDEASARKLEAAFRKAGAICELQDVSANTASAAASTSAPPTRDSARNPTGAESARESDDAAQARSSARASGPESSASNSAESIAAGSIAAAGDPNQTIVSKPVPQELDELEMSAPGEPLVTAERDKTPPDIDTSDLSISNEPIGSGRRTTGQEPAIDISELSIVPPE